MSCCRYITIFLICWLHQLHGVMTSEPLFLTPYVDSGQINEAQRLSLVDPEAFPPDFPKVSHAGYLTVNSTLGNHLFFWFFPFTENTSAPLLVWLNGGPGISSMFGLIWENGPIEICENSEQCQNKTRQHSWAKHFSMVYIDNPVSVGFSFTESGTAGERTTQESVCDDLYSFMEQFYKLFPELKKSELYIGGQSYAGKYVPFLAHRIHTIKRANLSDIPLTGIYIGGPFFDPPTQSPAYFNFLYTMGAISYQQKVKLHARVEDLFRRFEMGQVNETHLGSFTNILIPKLGLENNDNYDVFWPGDYLKINAIMGSTAVRAAVHAGDHEFKFYNERIFDNFGTDVFVSSKSKLSVLLDHYKVLLFSGDLDVIVSNTMVDTALLTTPWSRQVEYINSSKVSWWARSGAMVELQGFYSSVGRLCRVTIKGAGHQTPHDRPEATLEMMRDFVEFGCIQRKIKVPRRRYYMKQKDCNRRNAAPETQQEIATNPPRQNVSYIV